MGSWVGSAGAGPPQPARRGTLERDPGGRFHYHAMLLLSVYLTARQFGQLTSVSSRRHLICFALFLNFQSMMTHVLNDAATDLNDNHSHLLSHIGLGLRFSRAEGGRKMRVPWIIHTHDTEGSP